VTPYVPARSTRTFFFLLAMLSLCLRV
jgi:hypothetical protein